MQLHPLTRAVALAVCLVPSWAAAGGLKLPEARPAQPPAYQHSLSEALALARSGQVEDAFTRVKALRAQHPRALDVHMAYIQLAFATRRGPEAQAEYQAQAETSSADPVALYLYAIVGPDSSRRSYFHRAIAADPKYAPAHVGLAGLIIHDTPPDTARAVEELLTALRLDPSEAEPWTYLAYVLLARRDTTTAARAFAGAAIADTQWCYSGLPSAAKRLADAGAPLAAVALLERIPATRPDWVDYNIGPTYVQAGRLATALTMNDELLKTATPDERAWYLYCRSTLYAQAGSADSAFAILHHAIDAGFSDSTRVDRDQQWGAYWAPLASDTRMGVARQRIAAGAAERLRATSGERREAVLSTRIDQAVPSFGLREPLGGKPITLDQFAGQVVVLDFWATWCGPCRMTMPLLSDFTKAQEGKKVVVLSAQIFERSSDAEQKAQAMFRKNGYAMRHVVADSQAGDLFGFNSIPTLYVIGPDGRIAFKHVGYSPSMGEALGWQVDALLAASP